MASAGRGTGRAASTLLRSSALLLACAIPHAPARAAAQAPLQRKTTTFSVPLVWSGQSLNEVLVQVAPDGAVAIDAQSLKREVAPLLNAAGLDRLNQAIGGNAFVSPDQLKAAGVAVSFDLSKLELVLDSIDASLRPVQSIAGSEIRPSTRLAPNLEPAPFSAYLNTTLNFDYVEGTGLRAPDLFMFGAARYDGVVLEFDGGFTNDLGNSNYSFFRRGVRAVYDQPDDFRRWSAGDIRPSQTSFLPTPLLGGLAVEKSRRIFDPFSPVVNFGGRQIFLDTPSTVQVLVNGASYKTLQLQPGTYNLEDLPIQAGSNDIQLLIRDAAGRQKTVQFGYFYDPIDLEAGDDEYYAAAGMLARQLTYQPDYTKQPAFVGNYRRALSDTLVLGGGAQLSHDVQVVSAEAQLVPQVIPGSFNLQAAVSTGKGNGISVRGGYRLNFGSGIRPASLTASASYESNGFRTLVDFGNGHLGSLSLNAAYLQSISPRTLVSVGASLLKVEHADTESNVFADLTQRLSDRFQGTLGVEYGTGSVYTSKFGVRLGLVAVLGKRLRGDATYQSRRDYGRVSVSHDSDIYVGSLGYSASLERSGNDSVIEGIANYVGNRFDALASVSTQGSSFSNIGDRQTARLQIGTSIAFAGGAFGIGRPIDDSFLLVHPHQAITGDAIIGRSLDHGVEEAESGPLGSGIFGRLVSYRFDELKYDLKNGNEGVDIGDGVVRVKPPYRSGYELVVGNDRFVSAFGTLEFAGKPAALQSGTIVGTDDHGFESQPFFTNSVGRFGIIGLAPGHSYRVEMNQGHQGFEVTVPKDNRGLYRLGTINLEDRAS